MKTLIEYCLIITLSFFIVEWGMHSNPHIKKFLQNNINQTKFSQSNTANLIIEKSDFFFLNSSNIDQINHNEIKKNIFDNFNINVDSQAIDSLVLFHYDNKILGLVNYQNINYIIDNAQSFKYLDNQNKTIFLNNSNQISESVFKSKSLTKKHLTELKLVFSNLNYRISMMKDKLIKLDTNYQHINTLSDSYLKNPQTKEIETWRHEFLTQYKINDYKNFNNDIKIGVIDGQFNRQDKVNFPSIINKNLALNNNLKTQEHGSHVTGIIYAINPNAKIINYSVYDQNKDETLKNIPQAIIQAKNDQVNLINLSLSGNGYSEDEYQALQEAVDAGITVVISAGNNGEELSYNKCNSYPSCYKLKIPELIIVGNTDESDLINFSSNYGEIVDYYVNGTNIKSLKENDGFTYLSGTSMSAPFITGMLSLKAQTTTRTIASKNY